MGFENGQLVRVVLRATKGGDNQVNVLHYDLKNPPVPIEGGNSPQDLADRIRDDVVPKFKILFDSSWTIQPVIVEDEKDPQNPTAPRGQWTSGATSLGTSVAAGDLLPRSCCVVVTLRTAHIGRRFTGRMFVGGIVNEAKQNNGLWDSSWLTLVDDYVNSIPKQPDIAGLGSDGTADWSVFSRTQRAQDLDPYANAVTTHTTHQEVHWLRSREQF